jgi:hypothetical protein
MTIAPNNIFRQIITRQDVEQAALDTLQIWIDTYLAEVERQKGITVRSLPRPRSWTRRNEFERWPEDQIPAIIVVSPGLSDPPMGTGNGAFRADWDLGIAVVAEGQQTNSTRDLVGYYTAAIRALIIQRPSLGGFAMGVIWTGERYDDISDTEIGRTMASGQVLFQVTVEGIVSTKAGPVTPDTPPVDPPDTSPTWPIATQVSAEYELEDIDG